MFNVYETFQKIAPVFGPSGREGKIADALRALAAPYADDVSSDALGNLIAYKKGTGEGKKIMVSAHMDTTGFAATHVDEHGFVRFGAVGGLSPLDIVSARVVFENGVQGVVGREEKPKQGDLKLEHFFIDIGADSDADAKELVQPGDFAVFSGNAYSDGRILFSPYLDNRIGCVVLLHALSLIEKTKNELYFVFSSQEEVGLRGATAASYAIDPEYGIAVDVTDTGDTPEKKNLCPMQLGKGPAVKVMDKSVIASPDIVSLLRQAAKDAGIAVQTDILTVGGTDAGVMQRSRGGVLAGGLSIPCRYIHSPWEMAHIADVYNAGLLLAKALS